MKIAADTDIPYIKGVFEPYADVVYMKGSDMSHNNVAGADALLVRTRTRCDQKLLADSRVKMIATATIGFDHIDMDYCRAEGVKVATAAGSNARGVLQWIGAALVYASDKLGWRPQDRTIGVVGTGNVGSIVAGYASKWGFRVLCCDPPRAVKGDTPPAGEKFVDFSTISDKCDIITFHVPLTREGGHPTYHMANEGLFSRINHGTLLINSSRGEVVHTQALLAAVESGRCGCIIDTWEHEPHIDKRLLELSMLGTPHIAGYSAQGKANASSMAVQAIAREFGLPLTEWYPYDSVPKVTPSPVTWEELKESIPGYYDISADSGALKTAPGEFESLRNDYRYRTEYF